MAEHPRGFRWHGWARTTNGHIEAYVRVRAHTIEDAIEKIPSAAHKQWRKDTSPRDRKAMPHPVEDWIVVGASLHPDDKNEFCAR